MQNQMYYGGGPGSMMGWGGAPDGFSLFWMGAFVPVMILFVVWSLFWKGLALWHSGRRGQYWWFLILLVVNTAGILEIIYLFFVCKIKLGELFSKHTHLSHSEHQGH